MCIAIQVLDELDRVSYERPIEGNTTNIFGIFNVEFTDKGITIEFSNQVKEYRHIDNTEWTQFPTNQKTTVIQLDDNVCKSVLFHLWKKRIQDEGQKIDSDVDFISFFRLVPGEEKFILRRINPKSTFEEE